MCNRGKNGSHRIGSVALCFGQDEEALDGVDIGECRQLVAVEVVIGVHVAGGDPQDKVDGPCHLEAFHHFGEFGDLLFEAAQGFGRMVI